MLASLLIGLVAGQRAMTPLGMLAAAAHRGALPKGTPGRRWLARPWTQAGFLVLAAAEMAGDKMPSAPDRTIAPGLLGRMLTAAFAGGVLAPRGRRKAGAALAAAVALGSSFAGLALRRRLMAGLGRGPSGLAEDAAVTALGLLAVDLAGRTGFEHAATRRFGRADR
ncbi:DUF4126 domain-containing protein [Aureimonas sp. SK2]|uniref:DUF4126 domain-containing protein n=1 Tax=Aureimonas sp. SK2 TaxID=3015992 RepID=UPI00244439F0|nr:DUF4126 domain-containing protein [Aureimonas sp. SK2]